MAIRTDRPRIFMTPAILADLRDRAVPGNPRWTTLMDLCDRSPASWDVNIQNYCLAYAVMGKVDYAAKAWALMSQSMASGVNQVTGDSGYQCRNYFPAASMVLDYCYSWLAPAQRTQLVNDMVACANWVFPRTNPGRTGQWGVDNPGNNYHAGFMTTWMAGLALSGETPVAQGFIDEALRRWQTMVVPYLAHEAQGGYWAEGSNYGTATTGLYLYSLLSHQTATGEDLITNPWFKDAVTAMIQFTNPPMTELAPFGDLGAGPLSDNHRRAMLQLLSRDARCQPWLDAITPNICQQRGSAWLEFAYFPYTPPLPTEKS